MLTINKKMKDTGLHFGTKISNFNLPSYKTESGKMVCPFAEGCEAFCYAKKGNYIRFAYTVKPAQERNYKATKSLFFISAMIQEIKKSKSKYIRVHDSGDYYSPKYLALWLEIARKLPKVRFYSYTKSVKMFKDVDLPENYDVIFSEGSKQFDMVDLKKDRHARIFDDLKSLKQAGYVDSSKLDLLATKWHTDNNKIGLIFH